MRGASRARITDGITRALRLTRRRALFIFASLSSESTQTNSLQPRAAASLTQDRVTFVAGGGAEWFATKHIGVRAGARALVYKAPEFTIPSQVTNAVTAQIEPYAGVTFRF